MEGKPAKIPRTSKENDSAKRLIVILENASLETVKVGNMGGPISLLPRQCTRLVREKI
jgi:hypothetical protein